MLVSTNLRLPDHPAPSAGHPLAYCTIAVNGQPAIDQVDQVNQVNQVDQAIR